MGISRDSRRDSSTTGRAEWRGRVLPPAPAGLTESEAGSPPAAVGGWGAEAGLAGKASVEVRCKAPSALSTQHAAQPSALQHSALGSALGPQHSALGTRRGP